MGLAQVVGGVETIGFAGQYRPDCWTPMLVRLTPTVSSTESYLLQVVQDDIDGDQVVFSRPISLTGKQEGQTAQEQRFWMYFLPETTGGGMPNSSLGSTIRDLQKRLKVRLATPGGRELLVLSELPLPTDIDIDRQQSSWHAPRGTKLIVCVSVGNSQPRWDEYAGGKYVAQMERMIFVTIRPHELPENVLGYDAVDAIVWLDAPPPDPRIAAEEARSRAIQEYIRRGGKLVICQSDPWQQTIAFGDLLPVELRGMEDVTKLDVLSQWVQRGFNPIPIKPPTGNFKLARAVARPGTLVEETIDWGDGAPPTPYLVRAPYGLGSITWVAQDLGSASITGAIRTGWPFIWDRMFDLKQNSTILLDEIDPQAASRNRARYGPAVSSADAGRSLQHLNLAGKSSMLMTLAVLFFIAYWLIAGIGTHAYLMSRGRTTMSWFVFAGTAIAMTLFTVAVVRLVLRGSPDLKHITLVQIARGQPAVVESRFGLYIPEDGRQEVTIKDHQPGSVSVLHALARHPAHAPQDAASFLSRSEYQVPIRYASSVEPLTVSFPYRSTMKKLQARWVGNLNLSIDGSVRLSGNRAQMLEGKLINHTGLKLRNVYLAFKVPQMGQWRDVLAYLPTWDDGEALDPAWIFQSAHAFEPDRAASRNAPARHATLGMVGGQSPWERLWYAPLRSLVPGDNSGDDYDHPTPSFVPILSLYDRLMPQWNEQGQQNRFELLRRGGRRWDLSHAVAAGQLVILAQSEGPIPIPLEVDGDPVRGSGSTFYQFVLPIERPQADRPTTEPAVEADVE
jgi:hypothetical protein